MKHHFISPPMKSKILSCSILSTLLLGVAPLHAAETTVDPKAQTTAKNQVTQSMIGYRDTLLFYTFAAEKAVLVIKIDNQNDQFAIKLATLNVFHKNTTDEKISNWINNQHSCGLFPDVPNPVATHVVPLTSYSVASKKIVETIVVEGGRPNSGKFNRYEVEFKIQNVPALGEIQLKDFTDTASIFVKG
jgi:desulfoferrodoxin (superoxide reductase-like protein)